MGVYFSIYTLVVALLSYLLGCFNGAIIVSKYMLHNDIRSHGSGSAGLTNYYRVCGVGLTFLVILSHVFKAVFAMLIGAALFGSLGDPTAGKYLAGLFVMLGHMFPVMFHFRGGKGILSGGTVAVMLDWRIAVVVLTLFVILAAATKWVSLGSVAAGAAFPVATWFVYHDTSYLVFALAISVLVLWKHRGNIERISKGEESKFSLRKKEREK